MSVDSQGPEQCFSTGDRVRFYPCDTAVAVVSNVRRLAQYRPFDRGGLDLRAVLHDLVLAVAAIKGGSVDSLFECRRSFGDCWGLEVEIDELRPVVDELIDNALAHRSGKGFRLSPDLMADLESRAREWQQTEDQAFREWDSSVRLMRPGVGDDEMNLLRSDLREWLHQIITRHGAEAALMLYPEDDRARSFFDDVDAHGFERLPDRIGGLRQLRQEALRCRSSSEPPRRISADSLRACSTLAST